MFYRKCPICGANLDPAEHCTCHEAEEKNRILFAGMLKTDKDGQMVLKEASAHGAYTEI